MTQRADSEITRVREEWSTERGTTTIVEKNTTVVLVSSKGHLDSVDGKRMGALIDELLVLRPRHLFFDMGELASYHPDVRRDLTQLFLDQRQRVLSLHVLARSKLVRMGVSVARLALDALVGHSDKNSFNRALNAALADG
jgi:hypothetical protein